MIDRATKKRLKVALMEALKGKLPIILGGYRLETSPTLSGENDFLLVRVINHTENILETYFEVKVKESLS